LFRLWDVVFARMRWTRHQQILLAVIILLLALCGARSMVLAKQEVWSGLSDWTSDTGGE
jgi:hypothetical protein